MLFILLILLLLHFIGAILLFKNQYKKYKDDGESVDYGVLFIFSIILGGIYLNGLILQYILIKIEKFTERI